MSLSRIIRSRELNRVPELSELNRVPELSELIGSLRWLKIKISTNHEARFLIRVNVWILTWPDVQNYEVLRGQEHLFDFVSFPTRVTAEHFDLFFVCEMHWKYMFRLQSSHTKMNVHFPWFLNVDHFRMFGESTRTFVLVVFLVFLL